MATTLFTVGHSTRTSDELIDLLRRHWIEGIADVRRFPASRRHPHFNRETLERALAEAGIGYAWYEALGGKRRPAADTPNTALRVAGFRGYADHMRTDAFRQALAAVRAWARQRRVAIMCAEALYWRCHRQLISDALVAKGDTVIHILAPDQTRSHQLRPEASVRDGEVTYPPPLWAGENATE